MFVKISDFEYCCNSTDTKETAVNDVSIEYGAKLFEYDTENVYVWWQGQVYHIDWKNADLNYNGESLAGIYGDTEKDFERVRLEVEKTDKYKDKFPDFTKTTGYGDLLGLCGINCRHTFSPFYPDIQSVPTRRVDYWKNEEVYKNRQRQKALERRIRNTNRVIKCLKELDSEDAKQEINRKNGLLNIERIIVTRNGEIFNVHERN